MVRKSPYIVALIASICIFDQAHGTGEKDIDLTKSSLAASPTQERTMIFVSDLHLGVGRDPEYPKRWHNLEDFRWHKEFEDFLRKIDEDGKSKVDLVLVGDTLELWQSLNEKDCDHDKIDENLGCNEEEAKRLVKRVVEQHKKVFDTLSDFVKKGENRIAIIPGNHDAALQFEGVRKIVMDAFSDYARQWVRVATEGYWISADGRVYAEHGHQIGADPNKLEGWPTAPFIYHNGTRYLRQPWGEQFVQKYYNWYKKVFPVIDNLSEETQGISYAIKARGFMGTMDAVAKYVRFTLTQTSWKQTGQGLGRNGIPEWKLADIQRTLKTPETRRMFLIESMAKDDPVRLAIEEQLKNGQAFPNIPEFSTDEIQTLCNRRWAISKTPDIGVVPCKSTGGLGTLAEAIKTLIYLSLIHI